MMNLRFDHEKATQAINFFARQSGGAVNKLAALKLVYMADRYHLRKYGRPVIGDTYFAMKLGPVASAVKDIAEGDFLDEQVEEYATKYIEPIVRSDGNVYTVKSVADVDEDVFSDSDLEALHFAVRTFGDQRKYNLSDITHAYPEWKRHSGDIPLFKRIQMDYMDFFLNAEPGAHELRSIGYVDHFEESDERLQTAKEMFEETCRISSQLSK